MQILLAVTISTLVFIASTLNSRADSLLMEIDDLLHLISSMNAIHKPQSDDIIIKPRYSSSMKIIIQEAASRYSIHPHLIESIIKAESNFNPVAVSEKGAMGLMQLMPDTAKEIGVTKPFDPQQNIMGGTYYYRLMLERFGNHRKALYAYNCGPECVVNGRIPGETKKYANNVIREYKNLKHKENKNEK